jgi:hypothetical protein
MELHSSNMERHILETKAIVFNLSALSQLALNNSGFVDV